MYENEVTKNRLIALEMINQELLSLLGDNSAPAQTRRAVLLKAKEREMSYE